jgi:hypothetical protein
MQVSRLKRLKSGQGEESNGNELEDFLYRAGNLLGRDPDKWEQLDNQVILLAIVQLFGAVLCND